MRCLFCRLNLPNISSKTHFIVNFPPQNIPFWMKIFQDFVDCKWENMTADYPIGKTKMLWNSGTFSNKNYFKIFVSGVLVKCFYRIVDSFKIQLLLKLHHQKFSQTCSLIYFSWCDLALKIITTFFELQLSLLCAKMFSMC